MSKSTKISARASSGNIEVKSKFDAEFRRFGLSQNHHPTFDGFFKLVEQIHNLQGMAFTVWYTDPEGDLLPITNNENFTRALMTARPLLRIIVQRKGQSIYDVINGVGRSNDFPVRLRPRGGRPQPAPPRIAIGEPEDFRRVSSIIDVDILPASQRRVRLMKNGSDRPLGFYIRDGTSIRVTAAGLDRVPGVFISRLVPGGLAESTGLLAVNDEVLEVNGIDVTGKTLDQVTDMMVANSANLIITVKPVNQRNNILHRGGGGSDRSSLKSSTSYQSARSQVSAAGSDEITTHRPTAADDDEDFVRNHLTTGSLRSGTRQSSSTSGSRLTLVGSASSGSIGRTKISSGGQVPAVTHDDIVATV